MSDSEYEYEEDYSTQSIETDKEESTSPKEFFLIKNFVIMPELINSSKRIVLIIFFI